MNGLCMSDRFCDFKTDAGDCKAPADYKAPDGCPDELDGDTKFELTPWGCLYMVLTDYGVDVKDIPGRIGVHIVEDFMDEMVRAGHLAKMEGERISE